MEPVDVVRPGNGREMLQQDRADTTVLVLIIHDERNFRALGVGVPHVSADGDDR